MRKSIKINFSFSRHEFLLSFYENDILVNWKVVAGDTEEVRKEISNYYFVAK